MAERIQKILSQWGIASRRKAEKMILAGRVKVNDRIATLGDRVDITKDRLEVDRQIIQPTHRPSPIYLLLNKPLAVVSTCYDPQKRPTVIDLLPHSLKQGQGIHPVGRLDFNSTGALILTNDGNLTLNLTHPRYHLPKTYHVWLDGCPTEYDLELWRKGVMLCVPNAPRQKQDQKTLPAKVQILQQKRNKTLVEIILNEGRNRQIRRVARQLGFNVISLHRTAISSITLQNGSGENLAEGEYRHLTSTEVTYLHEISREKSWRATTFNQKAVPKKRR